MENNKRILITGANGGIGVELVNYLLGSKQYDIVCQYRGNKDKLDSVLMGHGIESDAVCIRAELTNEDDVQILKAKAGNVWGIVNMAGASSNAMSWKMPTGEFQTIINDNLFSAFMCINEFIPGMRASNGGRIINISSVAAFKGIIGASHYCAAKAGIIGLTKALAAELVNKNITVNALALGYFEYGMINQIPLDIRNEIKESIPMRRFGRIEELGGMIRFLLSDESSYITGQAIHINGGLY
ncbi:MAG: SDR family oxidoreductase [Planctomycetota bacterium]